MAERCPSSARVLAVAAVLLLWAASARGTRAGDDPRAATEEARRALADGDAARAVALLRDLAQAPAPDVAVLHVAALAAEATGARADALVHWRRLLARPNDLSSLPAGTGAEASARVLALSPFEAEVRRLRAAFVAACASVAEQARDGDPGLERRALRAAVAAGDPSAAVRQRLAVLGDDVGDPLAPRRDVRHVPPWATQWRDLVEDGSFGPAAQAARLVPLDEAAAYTRPTRAVDPGRRYVLEAEVRFRPTAPTWMFGLVFGGGSGGACSAFVDPEHVVMDEARGTSVAYLGQAQHTGAAPGVWHRLAVVVDGGRVDVWFDGQPYLRGLTPSEGDLSGDVALLRRDVAGDVRAMRVGRAP